MGRVVSEAKGYLIRVVSHRLGFVEIGAASSGGSFGFRKNSINSKAPAAWAAEAIPEALTSLAFTAAHRRRIRTINIAERLGKELKRGARVATFFSNEGSCLRLVSGVRMEISNDWKTGQK